MARDITALKALREHTQASLQECVRVLDETSGDVERAMHLLFHQQVASVSKRTGASLAESEAALQKSNRDVERAVFYMHMMRPPQPDPQAHRWQRVQAVLSGDAGLDTLREPEELHQYAWHYDWDYGCDDLLWIIRTPITDQGTALLIYWHAGSNYFTCYAQRDEIRSFEQARYDLVKEIEQRYLSGFYTRQQILFNPADDEGYDWTQEYTQRDEKQPIPEAMLQASPGAVLKRARL